jgi:hypothetical protein
VSGKEGFDASTPNAARIYSYLLGGKDYYAADRQAAEQLLRLIPDVLAAARENREFLGRSVRYLAGQGVAQFIDIGTGLPAPGNVHEVALALNPDARVVYVDNDAVVASHGRALLERPDQVAFLHEDLRDPLAILRGAVQTGLIDLAEPLAVLMLATMHFVGDEDDPPGLCAQFIRAVVPGSYLALTHITADEVDEMISREAVKVYAEGSDPIYPRGRAEVAAMFDSLELVEPGLVSAAAWRPLPVQPLRPDQLTVPRTLMYGGLGVKR